MLIYILELDNIYDASYDRVAVIENYESCIWTERFIDAGDFKLVTAATGTNSKLLQPGVVLENDNSSIPMLIETVEIKENTLTATGRTIETYFNQRIIGPQVPESPSPSGPIVPRVFTNSPGRIMGAIVDVMQTQHDEYQPIPGLRAGLVLADGTDVTKKVSEREPVYNLLLRIAKQYVVDMYVRRNPLDSGGYEFVFSTRTGVRRVDGNPEGYPTVRFSAKDDNFVGVNEVYSAINTVDMVFVYPPKRYSGPGQIGHTSGAGDMPLMITESNINSPNVTNDDIELYDLYTGDLASYSPFGTRTLIADSEKLTVQYLEKQLYRYGYSSSKKWADVPKTGGSSSKQRILQHEMIRLGKYEYNKTRSHRNWAVDGEAASNMFKFGRDYRLGDTVEVMGRDFLLADGTEGIVPINRSAIFGKREAIVTEYIRSASAEGIREYPTFSEPSKPAPYDNSPSEQGDLSDSQSWTPRMVSEGGTGINEAGGWYADGYPYLTFFRQGDLITVFGLISHYPNASGTWTNTFRVLTSIPEEFRPSTITRVLCNSGGNSGGSENEKLWVIYIFGDINGQIQISGINQEATPTSPWAKLGVDYQTININASYPARELALGLHSSDTGPL